MLDCVHQGQQDLWELSLKKALVVSHGSIVLSELSSHLVPNFGSQVR